jgi:hypothetical protein
LTVSTSFDELLLAPVEGSGEEKGTFYFPFHGAIYLLKVECPLFAFFRAMAAVIVRSILGLLGEWCREQHQSDGKSRIPEISNPQIHNPHPGKTIRLNFMAF